MLVVMVIPAVVEDYQQGDGRIARTRVGRTLVELGSVSCGH